MARNRDRQFSESENLKFHLDRAAAQAEERLPRWATQQALEDRPAYWSDQPETQKDDGLRQPSVRQAPVRKDNSRSDVPAPEDAWRRPAAQEDSGKNGQLEDESWRRPAQEQYTWDDEPVREEEWNAPPQDAYTWSDEPAQEEIRRRPVRESAVQGSSFRQGREENSDSYGNEETETDEGRQAAPERTIPPRPARPARKAENTQDNKKNEKSKSRSNSEGSFLRRLLIACVCIFLFLMVTLMVVSNFVDHPMLALPRKWVTQIVTPVQNFFSDVTDSVVEYLRMLKIRGNIEDAYDDALARIDELETENARFKELEYENQQLQDLLSEHNQENHRQFNPIGATVIGNDGGNYFATLTLNVGANDGVEEYMAVVSGGGLVGVTYQVEDDKCQVRCIINSDSTVAALVQSSRDQGSVKGTLGTNGEAMCRMYYLPDNSLPRPGDTVVTSGVGLEFPKGIPIGYIRESTRGMDENKSYVVLEPIVDFQHLEYVTVYRYKPAYAESAQIREDNMQLALQTAPTIRPVPTFSMGGVSDFLFNSPTPGPMDVEETPAPTVSPSVAPVMTATPDPNFTPPPANLEYIPALPPDVTPSPTPRPTPSPTPTPAPTQDPGGMTMEDEE